MENPIQNTAGENGGTAGTKLERLQLRARRLQQQAQQARERLREEESAQEKLARLMERRRIESRTAPARWAGLHRRARQLQDAQHAVQRATTCRWTRIYSSALCGSCTSNSRPLMTGLSFRISGRTGQALRKAYYENGATPGSA